MNDPDGYHLAWYGLFFQYKTFTPNPPFCFSLVVCQERAALHGRRVKDETSFCQVKRGAHNRLDVRSRTFDVLTLLSATIDPLPTNQKEILGSVGVSGVLSFSSTLSICSSTLGCPDHIPPRYS